MFTVSQLIERAESDGVVTRLSAGDYQENDNRVDGIDWDAYPHVRETV